MRPLMKRRSRKWLWWTLATIALIIYSIIVGSWIVEGNRHLEIERREIREGR